MKQLKYPLLILTFCLTGLASHAGEQYMLERLSNENGLSNNSVNCFCEDSRHRLWVGTWDGLNVYDGHSGSTDISGIPQEASAIMLFGKLLNRIRLRYG